LVRGRESLNDTLWERKESQEAGFAGRVVHPVELLPLLTNLNGGSGNYEREK